MKRAASGCVEIDYTCLEDPEDSDLDQELDPEAFREFVRSAVEDYHRAGSAEKPGDGLDPEARLEYNRYVGERAWVVLGGPNQQQVVSTSTAFTELMGFSEREITGRSILRMVSGPLTDMNVLNKGIAQANEGARSRGTVLLYNKAGEERVLTFDIGLKDQEVGHHKPSTIKGTEGAGPSEAQSRSPAAAQQPSSGGRDGAAVGGKGVQGVPAVPAPEILLTMDYADWVPEKIAKAEDPRCKVVIKAEKPNVVDFVSSTFLKAYGLESEEAIIKRTLRVIFGPKTDQKRLFSCFPEVECGRTQQLNLWTSNFDSKEVLKAVTVFPVKP